VLYDLSRDLALPVLLVLELEQGHGCGLMASHDEIIWVDICLDMVIH